MSFDINYVIGVLRDSNEVAPYVRDFMTDWKFSHHVYDENLSQHKCEQLMIAMCNDIGYWIKDQYERNIRGEL